MSLASDSRKHAQAWFEVAERLPPKQRRAALGIAETWFQLAMDAASLKSDNVKSSIQAKTVSYLGSLDHERTGNHEIVWMEPSITVALSF
jgi:hypothetical protein